MLKFLEVKSFKKLDFSIDFNNRAVLFVGPNNSGKTSALQAIAFWEYGLKKWFSQRLEKTSRASKRTGVVINRKDIFDIPVPSLKNLWKDMNVRELTRNGKLSTKNILIKISVRGRSTENKEWDVELGFDFANSETCYVRILDENENLAESIKLALKENIVYLPPISGLSSEEYKLEMGTIKTFIGQGKTADVLRNLCWYVYKDEKNSQKWENLVKTIEKMFGVQLKEPVLYETGRIEVKYREGRNEFDLINLGRGVHQVILLLSYMYANGGTVILIDEPDAHLEVLRQKEIFRFLYDEALKNNSQIIIATHSEAVLNEAIEKADIVAFTGVPHLVKSTTPVLKSLIQFGFENYLFAEQKKWVLYLEGTTDLSFLQSFAKKLNHPATELLKNPFVYYVMNQPNKAREHFFTLKDAFPDLKGIAIFDNIGEERLQRGGDLIEIQWERNEIENYLLLPEVLERYFDEPENLFSSRVMEIVRMEIPPAALKDKNHEWWTKTKISEWLESVLRKIKEETSLTPLNKGEYYQLVEEMKPEEIHQDVKNVLDKILKVASS
ncbi:MAG: ATP-dependent nuclease [Brevinematia bacterium]